MYSSRYEKNYGGGQYPVIWYNYLIAAKNNRILLAKELEKSIEQIADENKKKKEDEKKKQNYFSSKS